MAKLTLSFKTRKLKVFTLGEGETLIGRDPACSICIDSLAIEPQHARVLSWPQGVAIVPCDKTHPVTVNGEAVDEPRLLAEGDEIAIGKHVLVFSLQSDAGPEADTEQDKVVKFPAVGWLQILSGTHMGRTIRLDKAFTRIGRPETDLAIIARRESGYYLSHLSGDHPPSVNGAAIREHAHRLEDGDTLDVGRLQLQFFDDAANARNSGVAGEAEKNSEQRRFSRIPFDVPVTLCQGDKTWETQLVDLSLHGALVREPEGFDGDTGTALRLVAHLRDGPDIGMDAHVAHREEGRLGLACDDIDLDSITHLRRLVELNLGDAELVERELSALG